MRDVLGRFHRRALQHWFQQVAPGGFLIVVVSHAFAVAGGGPPEIEDRGFQRRYTPATLLDEVEDPLRPETYRLRSPLNDAADATAEANANDRLIPASARRPTNSPLAKSAIQAPFEA